MVLSSQEVVDFPAFSCYSLTMKKLYKATYHTVYYIDLDKDTIQNVVLSQIHHDVVPITEGYSGEITRAEELPDGWTVNDFPVLEDSYDEDLPKLTIGDILDGKDTSDLEQELKDLKKKVNELEKEMEKRKRK